ncbi:hypothetical protein SAMN05216189_101524 [Pseudomonas delhiensis]|uniref:Response regulatory domain-containing protein n=1 Tax=Pseudomonas delhiensis TaxID=366289 RepID=A0A239KEI7_9PSED|nr:response regulator [Pseudomonas delhiensis]SDJ30379.1 hypothetical protein SAMN05216189_101524 [Pseudomonas delhiensis]SNT16063.1 hypothetical protein SAMN06295949_115114 [Pseudomonas delhiensis]
MASKALRILIADSRHHQLLLVERLLNQLGYHRIATASSLEEAQILGRCGHPFDVLIINGPLIASRSLDRMFLAGVCLNGLIYQGQFLPEQFVPLPPEGTCICLPGSLELPDLRAFMGRVDPQAARHIERRLALQP